MLRSRSHGKARRCPLWLGWLPAKPTPGPRLGGPPLGLGAGPRRAGPAAAPVWGPSPECFSAWAAWTA